MSRILQIFMLITVLSIAPSILIMVTSFTRIVVVMSFLKSSIGLQQSPPNQIIIALSLFLTFFIMQPTLNKSYENGIKPLMNDEIDNKTAFKLIALPFHEFMLKHVGENELQLFIDIRKEKIEKPEDVPYNILIPAFMISELKKAFEIGFLIFVPFLIIDILVSSILMAMGMMMLPPISISLPFKIIFFVMIDGWVLISGSLVKSFS